MKTCKTHVHCVHCVYPRCREGEILFLITKAESLTYLFQYHHSHHDKRRALVTVLQQLNIAEVVMIHFHEV